MEKREVQPAQPPAMQPQMPSMPCPPTMGGPEMYGMPPCYPWMNMPSAAQGYCPTMKRPNEQLEEMYPQTYRMLYPAVCRACDSMGYTGSGMCPPMNPDMIRGMTDRIFEEVCPMFGEEMMQEEKPAQDPQERPIIFRPRRFLRDFITILLIRELLRRPRWGYGYGMGYEPGFWY